MKDSPINLRFAEPGDCGLILEFIRALADEENLKRLAGVCHE